MGIISSMYCLADILDQSVQVSHPELLDRLKHIPVQARMVLILEMIQIVS